MTLLFDENISHKICKKVNDIFPYSKHVSELQLTGKEDSQIWLQAKLNNYCIVTFDIDFIDLAVIRGVPPKIIWIRTGNISTDELVLILRKEYMAIQLFLENPTISFLEIK